MFCAKLECMNSIVYGADATLRHELEQRIRAELRLESGETLTYLQFQREVKKRLKKQMPSSVTVY
jgi:hypothetical protein